MATTTVTTVMGPIVISDATPARIARLRKHAEIFRELPQCRELADHPRRGRQTCLTVLTGAQPSGACVNAHRHVSTTR